MTYIYNHIEYSYVLNLKEEISLTNCSVKVKKLPAVHTVQL